MIEVKWTGRYPTKCHGAWLITINGKELFVRSKDFQTYGTYDAWSFGEGWSELFDSYVEGLKEQDWIDHLKKEDINGLWSELCRHSLTNIDLGELFRAIQAQDWRASSCGGCI